MGQQTEPGRSIPGKNRNAVCTMKNIEIGSYVRNFGEVGKVVGFHEITKDPILEGLDGMKWLAPADKCEPIQKDTEVHSHKFGFVVFE